MKTGSYLPEAFEEEGFIHCCFLQQIEGVLERYFRDATNLVLLRFPAEALGAHLQFEASAASGEVFPHLYVALPAAQVEATYFLNNGHSLPENFHRNER